MNLKHILMVIASHKKILTQYLLCLILTTTFFFALYLAFPSLRNHIIASNEVLDMTTAITFAITTILGLYYSRFVHAKRYRNIFLLVSVIAFVGFFSEVRLGFHPIVQRILSQLGITSWRQIILIVALFLAIAIVAAFGYLWQLPDFSQWLNHNIPTIIFLSGFGVFFIASIWLDRHVIFGTRSNVFVEELFELYMSISLLFCVLYLRSIVNRIPDTPFLTSIQST